MGTNRKENGLSTLKLILIIVGSIIAAVGIIFLIMKFLQKKGERRSFKSCCCDDIDGWEFDDDLLNDLRFDDCEECDCEETYAPEASEEISAAVDEAIEAISSITDEENE